MIKLLTCSYRCCYSLQRLSMPPTIRRVRESNLDADVLILGGGIAGLAAARALPSRDVTDFLIIEAQSQLAKVAVRCLADEFLMDNDPRGHLNTRVTRIEWSNDCVCVTATVGTNSNRTFCGSMQS